MAESGFTRFPVFDPGGDGKIVGMVALNDLLHARTRNLEDEAARERVLRIRMPFGGQVKERGGSTDEGSGFPRRIEGLIIQKSNERLVRRIVKFVDCVVVQFEISVF